MNVHNCACACLCVCTCLRFHINLWCAGSSSVYKCVSACVYICTWVCECSCPRCALLISYQGSLFAAWQVAISPLIQGLFVRWELHWGHMTKHFTSLLRSLSSSRSTWSFANSLCPSSFSLLLASCFFHFISFLLQRLSHLHLFVPFSSGSLCLLFFPPQISSSDLRLNK